MVKAKRETVKQQLYYAYANLAMAHSAVENNQNKYGMLNYMIRAKLYKGLLENTMNLGTIFDDEKIKLKTGQKCNYCSNTEHLSLDHIFPKKYGGLDEAENLIYACRSCNSSKGSKDLFEWMFENEKFPPLMIIRRYLKLTIKYCLDHDLMDKNLDEITNLPVPFKINLIPTNYPKPNELQLNS